MLIRLYSGVFNCKNIFGPEQLCEQEVRDMGVYFNPGNESFKQARNSQIFVDKTGLIEYLNKRISTEEKCIALSHARRYGKSHAAGMIDRCILQPWMRFH